MPRAASSKIDKIEHPQSHYATPDELIEDRALSFEEKCNALKVWEQDARQMLTASNEGMAGSEEGAIQAIIICLARSSAPRTNCNARQNRRCRAGAAKVPNTFISRGIAALVPSP